MFSSEHIARVDAYNARIRALYEQHCDSIDWEKYPRVFRKGPNYDNMRARDQSASYDIRMFSNKAYWAALNPIYANLIKNWANDKKLSKYLDWDQISQNSACVELLLETPTLISKRYIANNRGAADYILDNLDCVISCQDRRHKDPRIRQEWSSNELQPNLGFLAQNPAIFDDIEMRERINFHHGMHYLCGNSNTWATKFALYAIDHGWVTKTALLSSNVNPLAIEFLEQHPEYIRWDTVSENPAAINILQSNPDQIDLESISGNPAALSILEQNPHLIHWGKFCAYNYVSVFTPPDILEGLMNGSGQLKILPTVSLIRERSEMEFIQKVNWIIDHVVKDEIVISQEETNWLRKLQLRRAFLAHQTLDHFDDCDDLGVRQFRLARYLNHIHDIVIREYNVPKQSCSTNIRILYDYIQGEHAQVVQFVNAKLAEQSIGKKFSTFEEFRNCRNAIMHSHPARGTIDYKSFLSSQMR